MIRLSGSAEWPRLRTHRIQLGLYNFEREGVVTHLLPVTYSGARTAVPEAVGLSMAHTYNWISIPV